MRVGNKVSKLRVEVPSRDTRLFEIQLRAPDAPGVTEVSVAIGGAVLATEKVSIAGRPAIEWLWVVALVVAAAVTFLVVMYIRRKIVPRAVPEREQYQLKYE